MLLTYDANGGYGHRDHVKVHHVGAARPSWPAPPASSRRPCRATCLLRAIRSRHAVYRFPPEFDPTSFERAYSASGEVTHRISVRRHAPQKRASMRAHASQATADGGADRTLAAFLRIPRPLFDLVFGREWFVDAARPAGAGCPMTSSTEVDASGLAAAPPLGPEPAAPPKPRFTWVRLLQVVLGLGLAVFLLGWALPYFAHTTWADVWAVLQGIPATTAFGLFLLMVLRAVALHLHDHRLPAAPAHVKAFIVNVSGSAVGNLLPAGGAAGAAATYQQLRSWGFGRRAISTSLIVTGVWNIMARLLLPIIGIGLMILFAGDLNPAVMKAAAVGAVGGIVVLGPLHHDAGVRTGLSRHRRLAAAGPALPAVRCATPSPACASTSSTSGTRPSRWSATGGCR